MVKVKIEVELPIEVKGNNFVIDNLNTLVQVMGTTSVSGNLNYYGIEKKKNKFVVPIQVVKERVIKLKADKESIENRINFIEKVIDATEIKVSVRYKRKKIWNYLKHTILP